MCYDKYTVRDYVKKKVGEVYLNEVYGVYDNADEIDFEKLPSKFVLKITQSSGKNIICVDKSKLNIDETIRSLNKWLKEAQKCNGQEESYVYNGHAKILCEKLLQQKNGQIPNDYRIYCFNGEPKYVIYDIETTCANGEHGNNIRRNIYDLEWNLLNIEMGRKNDIGYIVQKPDNFQEIIKVARSLSHDFPFVRVDLYNLDGKIIFGELTWIPMGGNCIIKPDSFDYELGKILRLPDVKISLGKKLQK